ncbi:MAG: PPOX class F420-dependent oxidoreductase [Dehalococcoidia bacterium]
MLSDQIRNFVAANRRGVLTTFRRNGAAQMSIITCGPYRDGVAFTTTAARAKLANLRRNPQCTLMVSQEDWRRYVVLQGHAEILSASNTEPEAFKQALQEAYRSAAGQDHPNWDEYHQAMLEQRRSVVIVVPDHIYSGNMS